MPDGVGPIELVVMALAAAVVVAIVYRALRVDDRDLARWEASAGVRFTDASRPVLLRYLLWSRRFRAAGALAGLIGGLVTFGLITDQDVTFDNTLSLVLAGYLLGAILAEVAFHRPGQRSGVALLVPRRLTDYLSRSLLVLQRGLGLVSAALPIVYAQTALPQHGHPAPSVGGFALFGVGGLFIALLTEGLQRMIVSRRQPVTTEGILALDDALRSSSVHVLAGAGIGMLLLLVAGEVAVFTLLGGDLAQSSFFMLSLVLMLSALFFWLNLTRPHGFRVRRSSRQGVAA